MTDVDIGDDEIEDLVIGDVGCIICLKTKFSLGSKIYNPKNILSKSPAPCAVEIDIKGGDPDLWFDFKEALSSGADDSEEKIRNAWTEWYNSTAEKPHIVEGHAFPHHQALANLRDHGGGDGNFGHLNDHEACTMDLERLDAVGTALRDAFEYQVNKSAHEAAARECDISCGGGQVDETKCMCTDCTTNNCCPGSMSYWEKNWRYWTIGGGGTLLFVGGVVAVCYFMEWCCFKQ